MTDQSEALMAMMVARAEREKPIIDRLLEADPSLGIAAIIMAGDILSAEDATARVAAGEDPWRASIRIGSYARLDWVIAQHEAGRITARSFYRRLPELWRSSDPDDTDPRFLAYWGKAWRRNLRATILDGDPLPEGATLTLYRGQDPPSRPTPGRLAVGIAWTTDRAIAEKFAMGAGLRQAHRRGVVLTAQVARGDVLAYLTGRGESEAIVDPAALR